MLQDKTDKDNEVRLVLLSNGFRILLSPFDNTFKNDILLKTVSEIYWLSALKYRDEFLSLFTSCYNCEDKGLPEERVEAATIRLKSFFETISKLNESPINTVESLKAFKGIAITAYNDFTAISMDDCP